ncbi:helix-turn-helix transcriptional regulator [Clostridium sporogenes]|uniref:helix-turn-helix domain-containing protein n=1 Tax=Clostridium sporogenes TaxID=1509 RepID=UPI0013D7848C|nr:helix-turn-helix transcriptional regulator [Clostridium sporogenes]MDU6337531.1 helix-turn-helix transcriptional regulator [Clostridium sporogenes]NFQ87281.1 helix-turn-helix transcriptional regulator [Clostridium sporogenes]
MSRVSDKIKEARIKKGLTQKQLAKKLGVAENFINEVESGRKIINESLMNRISKVLGKGINDIGISFEEEVSSEPKREISINKDNKIKDVWDNAFSSIIKDVPVYNYSLDRIIDNKQLPIIGNKVQGIHQDKVLFLKIEEEDMSGFRINKGDIAFGYIHHEMENNCIFLIEHNNKRSVRQLKRLDGDKILLINNGISLRTEAVRLKDIKIIAKLLKVEVNL